MEKVSEYVTVTVDFKEVMFDKEGLLADITAGIMLNLMNGNSFDKPDQVNVRHEGKTIATVKRTKKAIVMPTEKTEEN